MSDLSGAAGVVTGASMITSPLLSIDGGRVA
jgi:hypothetical protein